jgi:hypothetical protein
MRLEAGTYNHPDGGIIILRGDSIWYRPEGRIDPMSIIRWSNEWPLGDVAQFHLRVWKKWWVRVV